ncbi:hypothetical protein NLM16_12025, partial [Bradyrhizobium brasilense]|uniref:hypothetical protein n=1 Tax=Bradyrhizobium brasilense TaxID=1419277 RepID=UPI0028777469
TVDLGHSSDGPSWIDLAENRVNTTESSFEASLNRLLQQNRPEAELTVYFDMRQTSFERDRRSYGLVADSSPAGPTSKSITCRVVSLHRPFRIIHPKCLTPSR